MQSPQAKLKQIGLLLASWPSATGEGDEHLRGYMLAVDDYQPGDVEAAVTALIKGNVPGVNPSFLPPPATVGAECRRQLNLRLDSEHRAKLARPALPPPMVEHSPESRAKVAALVEQAVARSAEAMRTEESTKDRTKILRETNARFMPDMDDLSVWRRLGYRVGDKAAEDDAA